MMRVSLLAKAPAISRGTLRNNIKPEAKVHTPSRAAHSQPQAPLHIDVTGKS
jgi:hypothetical protein